jgi:hypothetical protein
MRETREALQAEELEKAKKAGWNGGPQPEPAGRPQDSPPGFTRACPERQRRPGGRRAEPFEAPKVGFAES